MPGQIGDDVITSDERYGAAKAPKRIKDHEYTDRGDMRINPLWTALDQVSQHQLIGNRNHVWIYSVTEDGRIRLGSEHVTASLSGSELRELTAVMRRADRNLTTRGLAAKLDGLGHPGVANGFTEDGRAVPGNARISGEFRWSDEAKSWTVNDKSGRYMSASVRPDLNPAEVRRWLNNVAEQFSQRLGVTVIAQQLKAAPNPGSAAVANAAQVPHALTEDRRPGPPAGKPATRQPGGGNVLSR